MVWCNEQSWETCLISDVDGGGNLAKWKLFQAEPSGGKHCSRWRGPVHGTELFIAHYSCHRQPLINHGNNDRWGTIETGSTSWNLYKLHPRKAGAARQSAEQQQKRGWLRALNQRGSHGPQAPALPTAHTPVPGSAGESSAVFLPSPSSACTTHAATCAALYVSHSVIEPVGLKWSCACPTLRFLEEALFSISIL